MCGGGGGGHTVRDPYQYPTRPTPWGQALGGHGRITGRPITEAPMCIISGGDQPARYGGHPHASQRAWYEKQARLPVVAGLRPRGVGVMDLNPTLCLGSDLPGDRCICPATHGACRVCGAVKMLDAHGAMPPHEPRQRAQQAAR